MWKPNRTATWLGNQSASFKKKLIERAIKYGPEWKKRSVDEKSSVNKRILERIEENKRKKDEKAVKLAERRNAALDAVLAEGGKMVSSKEELDELYLGPRAVERMKEQIRFRSLIRNESIAIAGTKKNTVQSPNTLPNHNT